MNRIEREKKTVQMMIEIYCHRRLKQNTIPEEYQQLIAYAHNRLSHCRFGENKPVCKKCPIHCYAPKERQQIRELMRWVGPRMMIYAPKAALIHGGISLKHWLQSFGLAKTFQYGGLTILGVEGYKRLKDKLKR